MRKLIYFWVWGWLHSFIYRVKISCSSIWNIRSLYMRHAYCELCGKQPITPGLLPSRLNRLVPGSGHEPFEILSECHILGLVRQVLKADLWYSNGVPVSVTVADLVMEKVEQRAPHFKLCPGIGNLLLTTPVLLSTQTRSLPSIATSTLLKLPSNSFWTRRKWQTCIPGYCDYTPSWWVPLNYSP